MGLLDGKTAIVSGVATRKSIAWAIALALHREGARVALLCVDSVMTRVHKMAAEIGAADHVFACDARRDDAIDQAIRQAAESLGGRVDALVHSIAYANLEDMGDEFLKVSRAGWNLALEISAYSLVAMSRAVRPFMTGESGGSIITLSFLGGVQVAPTYNIMGVAKAALESTVRYLAYDLGPDRIRVNAVSPGPIPTLSSMVIESFDQAFALGETHSPLLRNVTPEEVGECAVFLASGRSTAITGAVIRLDCGMSTVAAPAIPHPRSKQKPVPPPSS